MLLGAPIALRAGAPAPKVVEPADDDLIEFLGSVDSDDEGWKRYMRSTGVQRTADKVPPSPPPSSAPGKDDAKDVH